MRKLLAHLTFFCLAFVFILYFIEMIKTHFDIVARPLEYGVVEYIIRGFIEIIKTPILIVVCLVGANLLFKKNDRGYAQLPLFLALYGFFWAVNILLAMIYDARMNGGFRFDWEQSLLLLIAVLLLVLGGFAFVSKSNKQLFNLASCAGFVVLLISCILLFFFKKYADMAMIRLVVGAIGSLLGIGVFALPILGKE